MDAEFENDPLVKLMNRHIDEHNLFISVCEVSGVVADHSIPQRWATWCMRNPIIGDSKLLLSNED